MEKQKTKKRSVIRRIDVECDEVLKEIRIKLERQNGIRVSIPDASKYVATKIRRGKLIPFWLD